MRGFSDSGLQTFVASGGFLRSLRIGSRQGSWTLGAGDRQRKVCGVGFRVV